MTAQYRAAPSQSLSRPDWPDIGGKSGRLGRKGGDGSRRGDHLHKLLLLLPGHGLRSRWGGQLWQPGQAVHVDRIRSLVSLVPNIDALCKAKRGWLVHSTRPSPWVAIRLISWSLSSHTITDLSMARWGESREVLSSTWSGKPRRATWSRRHTCCSALPGKPRRGTLAAPRWWCRCCSLPRWDPPWCPRSCQAGGFQSLQCATRPTLGAGRWWEGFSHCRLPPRTIRSRWSAGDGGRRTLCSGSCTCAQRCRLMWRCLKGYNWC